jgi:hypothetical protein
MGGFGWWRWLGARRNDRRSSTKTPRNAGRKFPPSSAIMFAASNASSIQPSRAGFTGPSDGLLNATRIELAEKVGKGEMTDAEANAQYAEVRYQVSHSDAAQRAANA